MIYFTRLSRSTHERRIHSLHSHQMSGADGLQGPADAEPNMAHPLQLSENIEHRSVIRYLWYGMDETWAHHYVGTREQGRQYAMETSRLTSHHPLKIQNCAISRQVNGHSFLGLAGCAACGLPPTKGYDSTRIGTPKH